MKIELLDIKVRDLVKGYVDNGNDGVTGYDGKLDIRPPFQREFIYKDNQRKAVIDTIKNNYPLNVMYWAVREDGTFEIIDGQQRTISICQYVHGDFAFDFMYFHNLQESEKEEILDYKLMVYLCSGTDKQKLKWFETINIAGEKLFKQELKNAVYSGSWVTDAKRYFSKNGNPAYAIGSKYLNGFSNRQDYLETAIKWISKGNIEIYMAKRQNEPNANELWLYFQNVINWVKVIIPNYRKEMKGVEWGELYNIYKDMNYDSVALEKEITLLMMDDDVQNKKGIYTYVFTRKEKHLNIRSFTDNQKRESYERQKGICPMCKEHFEIELMEGDHITPWIEGGKTTALNCQMLCREDNRRKGSK